MAETTTINYAQQAKKQEAAPAERCIAHEKGAMSNSQDTQQKIPALKRNVTD